jgi:hypothetical protein
MLDVETDPQLSLLSVFAPALSNGELPRYFVIIGFCYIETFYLSTLSNSPSNSSTLGSRALRPKDA